jgi:hypothetical protein
MHIITKISSGQVGHMFCYVSKCFVFFFIANCELNYFQFYDDEKFLSCFPNLWKSVGMEHPSHPMEIRPIIVGPPTKQGTKIRGTHRHIGMENPWFPKEHDLQLVNTPYLCCCKSNTPLEHTAQHQHGQVWLKNWDTNGPTSLVYLVKFCT